MTIPHFRALRQFDFPDLPEALCRQVDPDLFFPDVGEPTAGAKSVCRSCVERMNCLQWALDHDENFGVWGGLSASQRTHLRTKKGAA